MCNVISNSTEDTLALGAKMAPLLKKGDVVVLTGDLGSGKTLLVSGVLDFYNKKDEVLEEVVEEKKEELFRERMQKRDEIEAIQDWRYRIILKERYLHFKSYEKIAEIIGVSERHFHRIKLKDKAHEAFAKIYKHVIESQL